MNYVAIANEYIRAVLADEIVTCRWTKEACQRQVDDLARADWQYTFNDEAANIVCEFLEQLTHVQGELGGQKFKLEPWQCFVVTTLFGWQEKATGRRRFRKSFVLCGKGNGKSFLSSGLCLYMLCCDGEEGALVLTAGCTENQARIVYDVSYQQVITNPELVSTFSLRAMKKGIEHPQTGSVMRAVSAKGTQIVGQLPYYVSIDETWQHKSRTVVDECQRGCAKRANSLMSTITHCGPNLAAVGHEQYIGACAVLSKEIEDETLFCCMWSGEGYSWTTENAWKAANPNWDVSVYPVAIADAARLAQKIPTQQAIFRSHNCCEWVGASFAWMDTQRLVACRDHNLCMTDFRFWNCGEPGVAAPDELRPFVMGLDLASRQDILAVIFTCMGYVDGVEHYYSFGRYYVPEKTVENSPISQYKGWAARGLLNVMEGYSNNYEKVQEELLGMYRQPTGRGQFRNPDGYNFVLAAFDDWQAEQLAGNLQVAGITSVPFAKTAKEYSPVMDWLTSLVLAGRWHFPANDEILLWCMSNVVCKRDLNDNLFPRRCEDENRKIDAAIALLYSLRAAQTNGGALLRRAAPARAPRMSFLYDNGVAKVSGPDGRLVTLPPLQPEVPRG